MKKPNFKVNPLLADLPEYLKNPANFMTVMKQILNTLAVSHSHSELEGYARCAECTRKMIERRKLLKKLGFKNARQFYAWRRVHEEIARSYPLVDWTALNTQRALEQLKNN